ncbi:MAG: JDVT-CTERM system glutamic-type intramembrane protease [Chromatiales bacterium]|jgi:hypothetical protein
MAPETEPHKAPGVPTPRSFLTELGLIGRPRFHRDPMFWLAAAGGAVVAFGLRLWAPLDHSLPNIQLPWIVVSAVLVYPVIEELIFRGFLQGHILRFSYGSRSLSGITLANLLSTGAFTLIHFVHNPPVWAASTAAPSLVFGFFRDRHGTVYPCVALHSAYNFFYLLAAVDALP